MPRAQRLALTRPALFGPSRKARWRRWALRRAAAVGCAVAAVLLMLGALRPPPIASAKVVVAARGLDAGAVLGGSDLEVVRLPAVPPPTAAVDDVQSLVGRRLAAGIEAGEPVTGSRLMPRGPADGLDSGMVAAHVAVVDPGSLDLVSAGRRVSLYADVGGPALARDVLVLAVDTPGMTADAGSIAGVAPMAQGMVVALPGAVVDRVFAAQRPEGGVHKVIPVVTG